MINLYKFNFNCVWRECQGNVTTSYNMLVNNAMKHTTSYCDYYCLEKCTYRYVIDVLVAFG